MAASLQPMAYGISITFFILGTASIFLRLYTRGFILKTFGWDDVMAVILLAVNTTQQVILLKFLESGCGIHMKFLDAAQIDAIVKWLFIEEVFYYFTHWVIKQAFLLFYLRLSPRKPFRRMVWATMGLNTAFCIINWLIAFLQCIPFDAIFHPTLHEDRKCMNTLVLLIVPSILNIVTDLLILILPISTVWSLQMSLRRKIAVISVLAFGAAAVLISALRIIILYELHDTNDMSYVLGKMVIVAALEIEFAVVAVNLPSIKALWNKITGGSTNGSGRGISGGYETGTGRGKGYKLSSFERSGNGEGRTRVGGAKSRGSVTISRLDKGSESEEELFRQAGMGGRIKVTTKVAITSEEQEPGVDLGRPDGLDAVERRGS